MGTRDACFGFGGSVEGRMTEMGFDCWHLKREF
jgi:hypothetical protein